MYESKDRKKSLLSIDEHRCSFSPKWLDFAISYHKKMIIWKTLLTLHAIIVLVKF